MKKEIISRVVEVANYIINTNNTIRQAAKYFNISKSTIHKDLQERLIRIDAEKYYEIDKILKYHMATRHIIGGESTKRKYEKLKFRNAGW